jgi:type II secretory pathway component PulK
MTRPVFVDLPARPLADPRRTREGACPLDRGRLRPPAPAFVLLTVLIVVMLSSMIAVSLLYALRADVTAQTAGIGQEEGWAVAMSGIARAIAVAQDSWQQQLPLWRENPAAFQNQSVVKDGDDQWYFSIYSAADSLGADVRFGLTDESGKFSVYHTDPTWLARLPGLNAALGQALRQGAPVTNSVVDTNGAALPVDADDRGGGFMNPPSDPSAPTNALVPAVPSAAATTAGGAGAQAVSLDELFADAGLSTLLLYGEDVNFNLRLDPNEDDGDVSWPPDDANSQLDLGLQQYLTLVTYDLNVDSGGQPRANLNNAKADLSQYGLPAATLRYVAALRQAGRQLASPADLLNAEGDFTNSAGRRVHLASGIDKDTLATLLDHCTTTSQTRLAGLINVDTAPAAVLAAIPLLGQSLADAIVAERVGLNAEESRTPAWLYQRSLVSAAQFKKLAPYLTTRSWQFSFHCVAYAVPSGRYRVLAAVIDVAARPARILALRDLTRFGFPAPLDVFQNGGVDMTASAPGTGGAGS